MYNFFAILYSFNPCIYCVLVFIYVLINNKVVLDDWKWLKEPCNSPCQDEPQGIAS